MCQCVLNVAGKPVRQRWSEVHVSSQWSCNAFCVRILPRVSFVFVFIQKVKVSVYWLWVRFHMHLMSLNTNLATAAAVLGTALATFCIAFVELLTVTSRGSRKLETRQRCYHRHEVGFRGLVWKQRRSWHNLAFECLFYPLQKNMYRYSVKVHRFS
jgi:hypothetical protein